MFYSTDNDSHFNTRPDATNTPFRSAKNSNGEGVDRVPAGVTLDGSVKEKLLKGVEPNGRPRCNHIDGYNMLDSFSGKVKDSPHKDFIDVK